MSSLNFLEILLFYMLISISNLIKSAVKGILEMLFEAYLNIKENKRTNLVMQRVRLLSQKEYFK